MKIAVLFFPGRILGLRVTQIPFSPPSRSHFTDHGFSFSNVHLKGCPREAAGNLCLVSEPEDSSRLFLFTSRIIVEGEVSQRPGPPPFRKRRKFVQNVKHFTLLPYTGRHILPKHKISMNHKKMKPYATFCRVTLLAVSHKSNSIPWKKINL